MKAYSTFTQELNELLKFYKTTSFTYDQTDSLFKIKKGDKLKIEELLGTNIIATPPFKIRLKKNSKNEIRKNLCELVFIRLVSALEIFFIDLIKDVFLINKEPFKKQDISPVFTQAELLSIQSMAEIYNKIINKECRKLTSGGFQDIVKFYRKYFNVDMGNFSPGLKKMEEYHDRRHLQVHRLGSTDQSYRDKYNYSRHIITIDDDYLVQCFQDFKSFSDMVNIQVIYQIKNEFTEKRSKVKSIEREVRFMIEFQDEKRPDCLNPEFEFWCDDEFMMLRDILDEKKNYDNTCELAISGRLRQVKFYLRYIRSYEKKSNSMVKIIKDLITNDGNDSSQPKVLDEKLLESIMNKLPVQPWPTGIHKVIANELQISNKIVSIAIQQLITKGIFKNQINGIIVDTLETN
jgi:hypothetical protein